jgi:multicomponent K+:H+ antiporter subunit G
MTGTTWADVVVAILLALSGVLAVVSAIGFVRLPDFFLRMHPPALAYTLATWCVAGAAALHLSVLQGRVALHPLLLPVFLALTVPVTTVLLARVSLFRRRHSPSEPGHGDVPRPLRAPETPAPPPE